MICAQALQLFCKNAFCIVYTLNCPDRQLCCQIKGIAVIFLQHFADKRFTVTIMVRIRGVDVIDTCCDGTIQKLLCSRLIDFAVRCGRKTHTAKAKQ